MSQRTHEPVKTRRSALDRAIITSIVAMVAMNVLVLAQQLQSSAQLALGAATGAGLA